MEKPLSRYWLLIGTLALAVAGLFSLVLVVARTPQLASLPWFSGFFHKALVAHVDLSVLVWFLAIACLMWSRIASRSLVPFMEESALISFALGTACLVFSPFDPGGTALMSNYIPVIHSPLFFIGLALVFCGTGLMVIHVIASAAKQSRNWIASSATPPRNDGIIHFALRCAALITLAALIAFALSYRQMSPEIDGQQYYELLFWGGGHLLQFTHVQVMMATWLMLLYSLPLRGGEKLLKVLFSIAPLAAAAGLASYLFYDVTSQEHRLFFTDLMIWANGIAPAILALLIAPAVWRTRKSKTALWTALSMSLLLFIYGGVLGSMIEGENVVVPAHYHGSIVGVTLAFMGVAFLLLPEFGWRDVMAWRLAWWQPIVYGSGQLLHISGLAYSGGYGVLRKTPGEIADIAMPVKIALGVMGLGGLLAIIGGFMFVVVIARAVFYKD